MRWEVSIEAASQDDRTHSGGGAAKYLRRIRSYSCIRIRQLYGFRWMQGSPSLAPVPLYNPFVAARRRLAGIPFTSLSQILPFILIGIGVDDMVRIAGRNAHYPPTSCGSEERRDRGVDEALALLCEFVAVIPRCPPPLVLLLPLHPSHPLIPEQFVILASLDHVDPTLEIGERMGRALRRCGVSITCEISSQISEQCSGRRKNSTRCLLEAPITVS